MHNRIFNWGISVVAALSMVSCTETEFDATDVPFGQLGDRAETIEVPLRLHTDKPSVIGKPLVNDVYSRAEEGDDEETPADPEKAAEEAIKNIWVFQYDNKGNQLIVPRYYEVNTTIIKELNIRLAEGEESRVYVLANTGDPEWAKDKDLTTVEKFVAYEYPFTEDNVEMGEDEYLLMEGNVKETIKKETDLLPVDIHLTRMMAKISFKYITTEASKNLKVTRVIINNMPEKMRMEETPVEENYPGPNGEDFATRSVTIDKRLASGEVYTFYMPANRRGETDNTDPSLKNNGAPDKALYVQLFVSSESNGSNYLYTIYLGANDKNDYNVRRNHNYNISLKINSENRDDRVLAAPANCYVLGFNENIMFDPYSRTEKGGGWDYTKYVKKGDPDKEFVKVDVLWQEQNVIGDNTAGDKVFLDEYNRVHVNSGSTAGNAVIAGYNKAGEIVWSWHIWVNDDRPAQISKAVAYSTYTWDDNGIYTGSRVKGRSLMQCNLGAHSATGTGKKGYGAVYQWGRKDPFPIGWKIDNQAGGAYAFTAANIGTITDNSNKAIKMTSDGGTTCGELFDYMKTNEEIGNTEYTLKHPTVFLGATNTETSSGAMNTDTWRQPSTWVNNGDWYWGGEDRLWGGKPFAEATKKRLVHKKGTQHLDNGVMAVDGWLLDTGAKEKSLFDPCPAGWMVPPHDMWLSFTKDGLNSGWGQNNNATNRVNGTFASGVYGHYIYVQAWKSGPTVYFPSNGFRNSNGTLRRNGGCGNYHTSTPSTEGTVNCFHIHNQSAALPFEPGYESTRRAFAGPIRCVRDVDE